MKECDSFDVLAAATDDVDVVDDLTADVYDDEDGNDDLEDDVDDDIDLLVLGNSSSLVSW